MKFLVITETPDPDDLTKIEGNLAMAPRLWSSVPGGGVEAVDPLASILTLRAEVFHVGEVLICSEDGRELPYPGRKPDKWSVRWEEFDDLDLAIERARIVMAAAFIATASMRALDQ